MCCAISKLHGILLQGHNMPQEKKHSYAKKSSAFFGGGLAQQNIQEASQICEAPNPSTPQFVRLHVFSLSFKARTVTLQGNLPSHPNRVENAAHSGSMRPEQRLSKERGQLRKTEAGSHTIRFSVNGNTFFPPVTPCFQLCVFQLTNVSLYSTEIVIFTKFHSPALSTIYSIIRLDIT